jgi:hypothetical protein
MIELAQRTEDGFIHGLAAQGVAYDAALPFLGVRLSGLMV